MSVLDEAAKKLIKTTIDYAKSNNPSWNFSEAQETYLTENKTLVERVAGLFSQVGTLKQEETDKYFSRLQSDAEKVKEIRQILSHSQRTYSTLSPTVALYTQTTLLLSNRLSDLNIAIGNLRNNGMELLRKESPVMDSSVLSILVVPILEKQIEKCIDAFVAKQFAVKFQQLVLHCLRYSEAIQSLGVTKRGLIAAYSSPALKDAEGVMRNEGMGFASEKIYQSLINSSTIESWMDLSANRDVSQFQEAVSEDTLNTLRSMRIDELFKAAICSEPLLVIIKKDTSVIERLFNKQSVNEFVKNTEDPSLDIEEYTEKFIATALESYTDLDQTEQVNRTSQSRRSP